MSLYHLLGVFLFVCALGAPDGDEVTSLPGWSGPLPSRMYSGFIDGGVPPNLRGSMWVHYCFIESENDPKNDPVLVWYNGGPGSSSMFGQLVELGPLLLNQLSLDEQYNKTGIPTMVRNPNSWTKFGNLLVVDNPPPVGFSYCDPAGPSGDGFSCGNWNDSYVAHTNKVFLTNFFKSFPEFSGNDLYLTGESYAGIYVPTIVREIVNDPTTNLNLKGFAVGDGCLGVDVLCGPIDSAPFFDLEFFHGHGQISNSLYYDIKQKCPESGLKTGKITPYCQSLVDEAFNSIGGYNNYNLYDDCIGQNLNRKHLQTRLLQLHRSANTRPPRLSSLSRPTLRGALNDYPCPGPAENLWLSRPEVRKALNVPLNSNFFDGGSFNYQSTERNLLPFYANLVVNSTLRVLVYQGESDPDVNPVAAQDSYVGYFRSVGISQRQKWRPWTLDGKHAMGGHVIRYDGNFDFLTIRGSGHMVPEFKPKAASVFLSTWLQGGEFPSYVPNSN